MNQLSTNGDIGTQESTHWYIWADSKPVGPIFFSRLRQMAHQGKLAAQDKIRKGKTGEWVLAETVEDLDFPTDSGPRSDSANQQPVLPAVATPQAGSHFVSDTISTIRDYVEVFFRELVHNVVDRLTSIRILFAWIICIGTFASFAVVVARQFPSDWFSWTDPLKNLTVIQEDFQLKRNTNASKEEWDTFAAKTRREIAPIIARLERVANASNPIDQELLWASRDYLPKLLDDAREGVSESELQFNRSLQSATWLRQGRNRNGNMIYPRGYFASGASITDLAINVCAVLFVAFDIWLVWWFVRGRPKKTA